MTNLIATPAKLRDGSWGARVQGTVTAGQTVTIQTKAGKTWDAAVSGVVWSDGKVSLCTTRSLDGGPPKRASNYDPTMFRGYGAPRGGYRRTCKTGGNCSSFGSGRSCGGHDCDGF